ncbi:MAG: hypothetical protein KKB30_01100 [Proteobacteria bacterium]|nr:hypothetical protein [Pseudomonadota bacterium]MBU1716696.1 hypothetical protein [Pseudomonadota bacterium]
MKMNKRDYLGMIIMIMVICWAIPTLAAPKTPGGGDHSFAPRPTPVCKDPGNPMGRASINSDRPFKVGFEKGQFGQWNGPTFTPASATGYNGVSTYYVKQDVKLPIYARDCVRSVEALVGSQNQMKRVKPKVVGGPVYINFPAVGMIDASNAERECKMGSQARPGGPGYVPPVISYQIPESLHSKSIMDSGGPYLHEQYIDLTMQIQCWKE